MRQAFHIFKKDVRGLAYEIVVTLVLTAAFAASDSWRGVQPHLIQWAGISEVLLPIP